MYIPKHEKRKNLVIPLFYGTMQSQINSRRTIIFPPIANLDSEKFANYILLLNLKLKSVQERLRSVYFHCHERHVFINLSQVHLSSSENRNHFEHNALLHTAVK